MKGKGKGKGKTGKGKGYGKTKGAGKGYGGKGAPAQSQGKGKGQETRQCFNCYEYGRIGKDCPQLDKRTTKKGAKSFEESSQAGPETSCSHAGGADSLTAAGGHPNIACPTRRALSTLAAKTTPVDVAVSGCSGNARRGSRSIDSAGFFKWGE